MHHMRRLYAVWWVEMRYHPPVATAVDWERAHRESAWLRENYKALLR